MYEPPRSWQGYTRIKIFWTGSGSVNTGGYAYTSRGAGLGYIQIGTAVHPPPPLPVAYIGVWDTMMFCPSMGLCKEHSKKPITTISASWKQGCGSALKLVSMRIRIQHFKSMQIRLRILGFWWPKNFKARKNLCCFDKKLQFFIRRPPWRTSKIQKPPTLKRAHPTFQNIKKFSSLFSFCMGHLIPGSGSSRPKSMRNRIHNTA